MTRGTLAISGFSVALALAGCRVILGVEPTDYAPTGGAGGSSSTSGAPAGGAGGAGGGGPACDANLDEDPHHCGVCGHDCLGGDCHGGVCKPIVLSSTELKATSIALRDGWLFWTLADVSNGKVRACQVSLCKPQTVAVVAPKHGYPVYPSGLAIGAGSVPGTLSVYYSIYADGGTTDAGIHTLAFDPAKGKVISDVLGGDGVQWFGPRNVVADDNFGYVALSYDSAWAARVPSNGTPVQPLYDTGLPEPRYDSTAGIALDDTFVYVALAGGEIYRVRKDGSWVGRVATGIHDPVAFDVQGDWIYWGELTSQGPLIQKVRKDGAGIIVPLIGTPQGQPGDVPYSLAVDDEYVYFTNFPVTVKKGTLNRVKVDGTSAAPEVLVTGLNGPAGVTLDQDSIYWATQFDGTVSRLAKPPRKP